ncbi:DMT family transporter [Roseovarius pelagicus]|uniref:DMT family transporter n=1 Tax=Roseovarius pelagicus TaxID=2980108 RepID=A0ABY6DC73_9RHOB|nr:DMT family transporter [Roseovarius pelagicus]UXX83454.1 DMT family transporter [Roseovarius pelagicus]
MGIALMVGFALLAPGMDAFAKLIGDSVAVAQVAVTRFLMQAGLLLPLAAVMGWLHLPDRTETCLHLVRAAIMLIATALFFQALQVLPIADAIAIFFVEPFILTLLGGLILREPIGPRRYIACAVGFAGALLIIQPSFSTFGPVAMLPLGTAMLFAIYMILTRRMATRMHPITLQTYTGLAATALGVPVLIWFNGSGITALDPVWPDMQTVALLLGMGVCATLSHICLSFALSYAPASLLAPIQYLEIVSATVLGLYLFGDFPDMLSLIGIALIIASGLFVFLRERHLDLKRRPLPAP